LCGREIGHTNLADHNGFLAGLWYGELASALIGYDQRPRIRTRRAAGPFKIDDSERSVFERNLMTHGERQLFPDSNQDLLKSAQARRSAWSYLGKSFRI